MHAMQQGRHQNMSQLASLGVYMSGGQAVCCSPGAQISLQNSLPLPSLLARGWVKVKLPSSFITGTTPSMRPVGGGQTAAGRRDAHAVTHRPRLGYCV